MLWYDSPKKPGSEDAATITIFCRPVNGFIRVINEFLTFIYILYKCFVTFNLFIVLSQSQFLNIYIISFFH